MQRKKAFIITGPESSGSVYISRIISWVVNKDKVYGDWNGYGMNGRVGDKIVCLHRSQPFGKDKRFFSLSEFESLLNGYDIYFIIATRDGSISNRSKKKRFKHTVEEMKAHRVRSKKIIKEILESKHRSFIWNYETFMYLQEVYLKELYEFLGTKKRFSPGDIRDANIKYLK